MRHSKFWTLMEEEFGKHYAHVLADQLVITPFQLTAREALGAGISTREVWEALCHQQDVPQERRLGRDIPPKP
ncbi:DUF3046 domain-containing protein [Nesterenkonia sphaerica]|uniref:DUF3046 domain-containing protein n=1 Tax=Nesterenkonia sphaerica TaxID=1804988 RepID=A0A5R9ACH4_9MICC|nr:DUF3046 domain-containing protein [Nesterenkonia sphaerica]TLP75526.1 DUF3046 domain-containing protein [Nesterenkonia sphaerica]